MDTTSSLEMVEWLHANRHESCTTSAMDCAAGNDDLEKLLFLQRYSTEGCTLEAAVQAYSGSHIAIFEWLVETYPNMM